MPFFPFKHLLSPRTEAYEPLLNPSNNDKDSNNIDSLNSPPFSGARVTPRFLSQPNDPKVDKILLTFSVFLALLSVISAVALVNITTVTIQWPTDPRGLEVLSSYTNMEKELMHEIKMEKGHPKTWFPAAMVRVNSAEPDKAYGTSSRITLSETDTMFYRWRGRPVPGSTCYIFAAVPPPSILSDPLSNPNATKWFSLSGDASAVQIWNISRPASHTAFGSMTWNTRPRRTELLGTVNWTVDWTVWRDIDENADGVNLRMGKHGEGWQLVDPTPRFPCETAGGEIMVEIACVRNDDEGIPCRLEFDQLFTDPMLAFDIQQLA